MGFSLDAYKPRSVKVKVDKSGLVYIWVAANKETTPCYYLERIVDPEGRSSYHSLMTFAEKYQGGGTAGRVLEPTIRFYRKYNISRIELVAGLSKGGMHWAKVGFVPEKSEWDGVARRIRKNLAKLNHRLLQEYEEATGEELQSTVDEILHSLRERWIWEIRGLGPGIKENAWSLGALLLKGTRWKGYLDLNAPDMAARLDTYIAASLTK
ncbi:hypothetical protein WQE_08482 [Paraburkholderia hospita]|uniref:Transposase n=1 Tax=Paraburkholderia hospita TaxID=169430 RepID=A0ABP2PUQ8_9BURK|nr:hypothetical protein [Paraburkholderia hospita]EIN01528.1 hypothetical protein WQE_08482 [Paraburkholderia hospita]OUL83636.1 hypothetical protein CA602_21700 [Paraburkholderia hospita]